LIWIGNDIVNVARIELIINKYGIIFLKKIFSRKEISYCISKKNPNIHFSGKFSAKEAVIKAIGHYDPSYKIFLKDVEILNDKNSRPFANFKNDILNSLNVKITISHTDEYASSLALIHK